MGEENIDRFAEIAKYTHTFYSKEYKEGFVRDVWQGLNDFSKEFVNDGVLDIEKFKEFFECLFSPWKVC